MRAFTEMWNAARRSTSCTATCSTAPTLPTWLLQSGSAIVLLWLLSSAATSMVHSSIPRRARMQGWRSSPRSPLWSMVGRVMLDPASPTSRQLTVRPRLIPVLLLKHGVIVRSQLFKVHQVIGNPMSTVERFSHWNVDELVILDISHGAGGHDLRRDDLHQQYTGDSA